jgi:HK97 family phage major capsid protein
MSLLKEKREELARVHESAKAKNDEALAASTPEERARIGDEVDRMFESFDVLEADIRRLERLDDVSRNIDKRANDEHRDDQRGRRRGSGGDELPDYRHVFNAALAYGIGGLDAEERAVFNENNGLIPLRNLPREERALAAGTDAAGGYTVPQGFVPTIDKTMAAWGPMLRPDVIDLMPTDSGNSLSYPTIDDTASRGEQVAENASITDDGGNDLVFGEKMLSAFMHNSEIMRVPLQLLTDSAFDFEKRVIPELFGERMARTLNDKLTTGTGSGQPQGIVTGAGAGVTAAAVAALTSDELIDLQHTVNSAYRNMPGCGWMFNDTVLKGLRKLKDLEGRYIWQRPDLALGTPGTLLDMPYYINPSMADPAAGTKPIVFGLLNKFIVRRVGSNALFVFREKYMDKGQLGFMSFGRYDGRVLNTAAIKVLTMAAS